MPRLPALLLAFLIVTSAHAALPLRVALLGDDLPGLDRSLVPTLARELTRAGAQVRLFNAAELADPARFDRARQDVLVLAYSPSFPGQARANVERFLQAGGHLVALGGFAYRAPVCRVQGQWRDRAAFERLLAETPAALTLFAFAGPEALSAWKRGTNKPEHPSTASLAAEPAGQCLRLEIRDVGPWQWDCWTTTLPASAPAGSDLLLLRARGDERTSEVYVEVDEADGCRWNLHLPITAQWQRYAIEAARFKFMKDGSPATRGQAGDHLNLAHATRMSVGLASGGDNALNGDHLMELDDIGVGTNAFGVSSSDFAPPNTVCFDTYEPYVLREVTRVAAVPTGVLATPPSPVAFRATGLSAVGFTLWDRSELLPLLQAEDQYGRVRGWAASALVHYGGAYKGGCWFLSGVAESVFYRSPVFTLTLVSFLQSVATRDLPRECSDRNEAMKAKPVDLQAPTPSPLRIVDGHFVQADGRRFFAVGTDYIGSLDRKFMGGPWMQWIERDFRLAHDAGINAMRIYGASALYRDPAKLAALKALARRYGVYLLIVVVDHTNLLQRAELEARAREVATAFAGEPMLLGYDLQNEPYLFEVAKVKDGEQTLGDRYPEWKRWGDYAQAANLQADKFFTAFPGVTGPLAPAAESVPIVQAASSIFGDWIRWQADAIRSVDKTHPIGVGYNSVFAALPCNEQLDFICHHCYEKPDSLAGVQMNLATMDRLHALWPGKPVALGEFGYTNGMDLKGQYLDLHTSALGEFLHYLYAFSQGYEGCMKWILTDHPLELSRQQCTWMEPSNLAAHIDQGRYGMFTSDGTITPRPKPLVPALRFLRDYVEGGGEKGELKLEQAANPIGTGYVFRAPHALIVGHSQWQGPELKFAAAAPAVVMLRWDANTITLVSTADAQTQIRPGAFVPGLTKVKLAGRAGPAKQTGAWLQVQLLEGEPVTLSR